MFTTDSNNKQNHWIYQATVLNTPFCILTEANLTIYDLICDNNQGSIENAQLILNDDTFYLERFNITNTPQGNFSIKIRNTDQAILKNGSFDEKIYVYNTSEVKLTDVFYDAEETVIDSQLTRLWTYQAHVFNQSNQPIENAQVIINDSLRNYITTLTTNSQGLTPKIELIEYINQNSTITYYSQYTIQASDLENNEETFIYSLTINKNNLHEIMIPQSQTITTIPQDFDSDGDVDGVDFGVFASCFNGAGKPPKISSSCTIEQADASDSDNDGDVDGVDFGVFASCYNGSGKPPKC